MPSFPLPVCSRLRPLRALALLALVACSPGTSPATDPDQNGEISISDAWVRLPPPGATVAAGYLHLSNPGPHDERLLAVDTAAAARVEIHDMQVVSGVMQMRPLEHGLPLPAGETTTLAPGGLHLMLMAPETGFNLGEEVTMRLRFEHAPEQEVVFQVHSTMDETTMEQPLMHGHDARQAPHSHHH